MTAVEEKNGGSIAASCVSVGCRCCVALGSAYTPSAPAHPVHVLAPKQGCGRAANSSKERTGTCPLQGSPQLCPSHTPALRRWAARLTPSLCARFGPPPPLTRRQGVENKKTYELSEEEINKLREEVGKYTTESDLRRIVSQNIKRLKDIGCYRGRRHIVVGAARGPLRGRASSGMAVEGACVRHMD